MKLIPQLNKRGLILMYHRITTLTSDPFNLCVSSTNFTDHMRILKKYTKPVQMKEMGKNVKQFSFGKKEIVVTFDDGYADNFTNAKPILESLDIPATFFIVSGSLDNKKEYWWDELERIILSSDNLPASFDLIIAGQRYSWLIESTLSNKNFNNIEHIATIPENNITLPKRTLFFVLWTILSFLPFTGKEQALLQIASWANQPALVRPTHRVMTSNELLSMSRCSLFEIGVHTFSHPMLSRLPLEEQEIEINKSKDTIEDIIAQTTTSFSYPHGDYSQGTVNLLNKLRFMSACTVVEKSVARNANPLLLPRFAVSNWKADEFEQYLQNWLLN
jgi:peptidoglycan/xylan/chitin deacetylase (PgdA/CDA1 family)